MPRKFILLITVSIFLLASPLSHASGSLAITHGSGFSDSTAVSPIGGNPGTTIGAQRSNVIAKAAEIWTGIVQPSVSIKVYVSFINLSCDAYGAVLGSAGPKYVDANFPDAPYANTWYPHALAEHLMSQVTYDYAITADFNKQVEGNAGCLSGAHWYYGYDHNPGSNQIDLLEIVTHEFGHGLGFATQVDLSTGEKFAGSSTCLSGCDDIFMKYLRDTTLAKNWPDMTNAERVSSAVNAGKLVWSGSAVLHLKSTLAGGLTSGYPRMYAPSTLSDGSSVSHWNTNVTYTTTKNELMEPSYATPFDMALTVAVMRDLGWGNAAYDYDGDGTDDAADDFPHKNAADSDTDGDGKPDDWISGAGCSGNTCSGLTLDWDDDNDGVPDTVDAAPLDAGNTSEINLPLNQSYKGLRYSAQQSH